MTAEGEQRPDGRPSGGGSRILLVEDIFLVAETYRALLEKLGYSVAGPAGSVADALQVLEDESVDGGLLDISLGGTLSTPVAARLQEMDRPFVFLTAMADLAILPEEYRGAVIIQKPVVEADLHRALKEAGL